MGLSPESQRLLLVQPGADRAVTRALTEAGYPVKVAGGIRTACQELERRHHDAVLVELAVLGSDPVAQAAELRQAAPSTPLIVLSPRDRIDQAIALLRHGVEDYLILPPDPFEFRARLGRILERRELDSQISFFQEEASKKHGLTQLEVRSPAMRTVLDRVLRVAPTRSTVLITGESGVGKELVARAVHFNSPRRDRPFIALNCAAISPNLIESELFGHEKGSFTGAHARVRGKFEIAHPGTLFLDEIGEMSPETQAKLLRVLEGREFMRVGGDRSVRVDVRVIAATNANLESMVSMGEFRQDLYYRLKVVTLPVPPLRQRRQDFPHLVNTFVDELARSNAVPAKRITRDAVAALAEYEWPGNVRELKNLVESLLVSAGDEIDVEQLPRHVRRDRPDRERATLSAGTTIAELEQELIRRTLEHTGGNRTHSAELLGIGVRTLQRKIRAYEITVAPRRRRPRGQGSS